MDPLLDLLEQATDRTTRARTLRLLVTIGPPVAPVAAARLKDAPYRDAWSSIRALAYIQERAGKEFDPAMARRLSR